ncbi:MAG: class II SORL domain-containing protein [Dehalococcoidia bacterium]|nr:MAG: class II SORL domain-containing protein [Dehalococcoidia bacterium]
MEKFGELFQTADWRKEKHVPVIECPEQIKVDEPFSIKVTIGKEIPHPNTTEHHIRWISVYFLPEDEKFTYQVGYFEFSAHGESVKGANQGPIYTNHEITASLKTSKSGIIYATALCNIHGLWQSRKDIQVS